MGKFIDLTGQRFGRLVVVERCEDYITPKGKKYIQWLCKCDCGNYKKVTTVNLQHPGARSCGCIKLDTQKDKMIGKIFGRLRVESFAYVQNERRYWNCSCECGGSKIVSSHELVSGSTQSCGCWAEERKEIFRNMRRSLPYGESTFNSLYNSYKFSASSRNLEFKLNKAVFKALVSLNCSYCGDAPYQKVTNNYKNGDCIYNGIDRKDSSIGYTEDNSTPCCGVCNFMKRTMGEKEFLNHIEKIHNYQKEKNEVK